MHAIRHLVTGDELPPRRVARHDDGAQMREDSLARNLPQDFVHQIERGQRGASPDAACAPAVSLARPVDFIRRQAVAARRAVVRGELRRDDNRVVERALEPRARDADVEIGVRLTVDAVHDDQHARDALVPRIERLGPVDQRSVASAPKCDPFGALGVGPETGPGERRDGEPQQR